MTFYIYGCIISTKERRGGSKLVVNRCVEQGIYVVLILSLEKDHRPLRSTQLSTILSVSDSYLKKILRKLVLAEIITSNAGKDGGFQLARSIEEISVYDVYSALEGEGCDLKLSGIGNRIFVHGKEFAKGEEKVVSVFDRANVAFGEELRKLKISELATKEHYQCGTVDFEALINESKK